MAADRAAGLFVDWLSELPEGALRSHVARLSTVYRELSENDLNLIIAWSGSTNLAMYGAWRVDGRVEIVGPYVHRDYRRQSLGAHALRDSFRFTWTSQDVYVHIPASLTWALDLLERDGMERTAPILPDGIGDHISMHANMAHRASRMLRNYREPRGAGAWVVILHNDDTTTYEFVIQSLMQAIDVNRDIATEYANMVHSTGATAIRFCRTERGARRLVDRICQSARKSGFPLQATYEKRR